MRDGQWARGETGQGRGRKREGFGGEGGRQNGGKRGVLGGSNFC